MKIGSGKTTSDLREPPTQNYKDIALLFNDVHKKLREPSMNGEEDEDSWEETILDKKMRLKLEDE